MLICREVDGGLDWSRVRQEMNTGLDDVGLQAAPLDPATWGLRPDQVAAQDRILRRGGNVGDQEQPPP